MIQYIELLRDTYIYVYIYIYTHIYITYMYIYIYICDIYIYMYVNCVIISKFSSILILFSPLRYMRIHSQKNIFSKECILKSQYMRSIFRSQLYTDTIRSIELLSMCCKLTLQSVDLPLPQVCGSSQRRQSSSQFVNIYVYIHHEIGREYTSIYLSRNWRS